MLPNNPPSPMSILLAIPSFNEAKRLPAYLPALLAQITSSGLPVTVEVVDDGSREEESTTMRALVESLRTTYPFLLPLNALPQNLGKGGAVHASWQVGVDSHDWLAFVDADGSLSPTETCRFLRHCLDTSPPRMWFASRIRMLGRKIERRFFRHIMGRVFASLVGSVIDSRVYDSQCGLKAIPAAHYRIIQPLLQETRFAFDVELLAAQQHAGLPVEELPVDWSDVAGSKVKPVRDTLRAISAVFTIRTRQRNWPRIQS